MGYLPYLKQEVIDVGITGSTIANGVTVTSSTFSLFGYSKLAAHVSIDRTAATALAVYLDVSVDGSTWIPVDSAAVVAGVATLSDMYFTKTFAADATMDCRWENLNAVAGRLRLVSTAGTVDTASVKAILGV